MSNNSQQLELVSTLDTPNDNQQSFDASQDQSQQQPQLQQIEIQVQQHVQDQPTTFELLKYDVQRSKPLVPIAVPMITKNQNQLITNFMSKKVCLNMFLAFKLCCGALAIMLIIELLHYGEEKYRAIEEEQMRYKERVLSKGEITLVQFTLVIQLVFHVIDLILSVKFYKAINQHQDVQITELLKVYLCIWQQIYLVDLIQLVITREWVDFLLRFFFNLCQLLLWIFLTKKFIKAIRFCRKSQLSIANIQVY